MKKAVDYIIVGQGLAGSTFALECLARGHRVMVYDRPGANRSSNVAAGMFNPFASKGLIKTWLAEEIFPHLHSFYSQAEKKLGTKFFYPKLIYRPFLSVEEQNSWIAQTSDSSIQKFVEKVYTRSTFGNQVNDPLGGIVVRQGGYLDTVSYLNAVRKLLIEINSFTPEAVAVNDIRENGDKIQVKNIEAAKIVFCTGAPAGEFTWLPVIRLKGEVLVVKLTEEPLFIYNRGVYVVSDRTTNQYKIGSTYQLKNIVEGNTDEARRELETKLQQLVKIPFRIVEQDWGIRPTTVDRKPVLGFWPDHPNRIIFNGLGTKGVSLAPYFSRQLADWLEGKTEIPKEVNINRFKTLYSKL